MKTRKRVFRRRVHGPRGGLAFYPLESFIDASIGNNLKDARKRLLAFANDDAAWEALGAAQSAAAERREKLDAVTKLTKRYFR